MPKPPPIIPANSAVRQSADGSWQYQRLHGPAPQGAAPWADQPATPGTPPAAVAHELAAILRERHGSSTIADFLEGVGCYTPGAGQTVQEESHG